MHRFGRSAKCAQVMLAWIFAGSGIMGNYLFMLQDLSDIPSEKRRNLCCSRTFDRLDGRDGNLLDAIRIKYNKSIYTLNRFNRINRGW